VASTAVVIAVGLKGETGEREVLGMEVGPSEETVLSGSLSCALW